MRLMLGPRFAKCDTCDHIAWATGWDTMLCRHQEKLVGRRLAIVCSRDEAPTWWDAVKRVFAAPTREQYVVALWEALPWQHAKVEYEDVPHYINGLLALGDERARQLREGSWDDTAPSLREIAESVDSRNDAYEATLIIHKGDSGEPTPRE